MKRNIPDYRFLAEDISWIEVKPEAYSKKKDAEIWDSIKKNPKAGVPLMLVVSVFIGINLTNKFIISKINEIEPLNQKYKDIVKEKKALQGANEKLKVNTREIKELIMSSVNPIEFAANLQKIVPLNVRVGSYELKEGEFSVTASSSSQRELDELIVLLGEHPMIDSSSIEIIEINSSASQQESVVNSGNQAYSQYNISLRAGTEMAGDKIIDLTTESGNYGLLVKLQLLNTGNLK